MQKIQAYILLHKSKCYATQEWNITNDLILLSFNLSGPAPKIHF